MNYPAQVQPEMKLDLGNVSRTLKSFAGLLRVIRDEFNDQPRLADFNENTINNLSGDLGGPNCYCGFCQKPKFADRWSPGLSRSFRGPTSQSTAAPPLGTSALTRYVPAASDTK